MLEFYGHLSSYPPDDSPTQLLHNINLTLRVGHSHATKIARINQVTMGILKRGHDTEVACQPRDCYPALSLYVQPVLDSNDVMAIG